MAARKNPTAPAASPAPVTEKKAARQPQPCGCGCGELTPRRFRPGHDARIPRNAPCTSCDTTATLAVGKVPSCDAHVASVIRTQAATTANGRVAVRSL